MIRSLILITVFSVVLNASLNTKIQNILGYSAYNKHKNLINHIFKNQSSYYNNGQVNYTALTQKLQSNGLLKLRLGSTRFINVTFTFNSNPKESIFILKNILRSLGHYYYFTTQTVKSGNSLKWSIKLKTAAAINPLRLSQALQQRNCRIVDIRKEGSYNWNYAINSSNASIYKAKDLSSSISLKKPQKPYLLKVSNAQAINITSRSGNNWHPKVVFYDDTLNILEVFTEDSLQSSLRLEVPSDTKYIKIDDIYTLANLKRGLNITKE